MSFYMEKTMSGFFCILVGCTRTLQNKRRDFRNYQILGACNPPFAFQALQAEDKIGLMLPCNVIVQEHESGAVEVAAIDPVAAMQAIDNPKLNEIATQVSEKLKRVLAQL